MPSILIPFEITSADQHRLQFKDAMADVNINSRPWKIKRAISTPGAIAIGLIENLEQAQLAFEDFCHFCDWSALNRTYSLRIHGKHNIDVSDETGDQISNLFCTTYVESECPEVSGGSSCSTMSIKLKGSLDQGFTQKKGGESAKQSALKVFQNGQYSDDLVAAYILYYASLDILSREKSKDKEKQRMKKYLHSLVDPMLQQLTSDEIKSIVNIRNNIAHEGKLPTHSQLSFIREIMRRVLQVEIYGEPLSSEMWPFQESVFPKLKNRA